MVLRDASASKKNLVGPCVASLFRLPDLVSLNFITIGMLSEIFITLDLVTATALSSWYDLTPTNPPARQSISRICLKRKFHSVAGTDYFLRHHTSTTLLQQYFSVAVNDLQVIPTAENCKSSKCESNSQPSLHCYCVRLLEVAWVQLRIFG